MNEKISIFLDNNNYVRMLNNFLCYAYAFVNYPDQIQISMLSSHPLELTFGGIRQCSRGNDTAQNAIHSVSKSQLRDNFLHDFGKSSNPVKGRCKIAGNTNSDAWVIDIPNDINTDFVPNEIIYICGNQIPFNQFAELNVWKLTLFLKEQTPTVIPNLSGDISGQRIINRLHNY